MSHFESYYMVHFLNSLRSNPQTSLVSNSYLDRRSSLWTGNVVVHPCNHSSGRAQRLQSLLFHPARHLSVQPIPSGYINIPHVSCIRNPHIYHLHLGKIERNVQHLCITYDLILWMYIPIRMSCLTSFLPTTSAFKSNLSFSDLVHRTNLAQLM